MHGAAGAPTDGPATCAAPFEWPVRVYYEDTDLGGVVYYANYLKLPGAGPHRVAARTGCVPDPRCWRNAGLLFAVTAVNIRYLSPARFEDTLVVSVALERHAPRQHELQPVDPARYGRR